MKKTILIAGLMLSIFAAVAYAHAITLWAYVEDGKVHVTAYTASGAKIKDGHIVVVDAEGKKLLEGKTDQEGNFVFAPPIKADMIIMLMIDDQHSAEFKLQASDFDEQNQATPTPEPEATPTINR